jgi:indolepyruvate ferredoxin oxidoreductase beta subunit
MSADNLIRSILFAGVGGQGIIKASDITCQAIMKAGLDVKKSEIHGMAQRGGCVTSQVRYGTKVYSPLAEPGTIHLLVSFEKMEALRYLSYIRRDASIIVNNERIYPPEVNRGNSSYPSNIVEYLKNHYRNIISLDASDLAKNAGNVKAANVVLLGALSTMMDIDKSVWEDVIKESFPKKMIKLNLEAFQFGINA